MADKKISELVSATEVKDEDLLLMEQDGTAKNMSGAQLLEFLKPKLDEAANEILKGLPQATDVSVVKSGSTITVTTALDDGQTSTSRITLNASGYPSQIVTDGVTCPVSWEGFTDEGTEESSLEEWEGGSY